jgi:predicted Zn-dependent peptidase
MTRVDRSRLPAVGPTPPFHFPRIEKGSTPGGLRIWTVEHRSVPVVTAVLLLSVGSAADREEAPGLASLTGDMLDEGAGDSSALEVNDALARLGAQFETEVGPDATILTLTTLTRFRERALALLADIVTRPRFDQHEFDRVRTLRANRLRQLRDLPGAVADRGFASLLYPGHPYAHLAIGTEEALGQITADDVREFHRLAYRASDATLVIVGDAPHDELFEAGRAAFAEWESRPAAPDIAAALARVHRVPERPPRSVTVIDRPAAAQSELRIGHVSVPRTTPDYHALIVLNMVLGGQFVSRINMNLREDKGYTYGARTSFDFRRGPGPFQLQASVQTAVTADAIRESLMELDAIRGARPVTAAELDVARAALTRGYPRNFETAEQIARSVAQLALYDLPDDYFERFVPAISTLDLDTIARVAREHLDSDRMTTLVVGDRAVVEPTLAALDLGGPATLTPA